MSYKYITENNLYCKQTYMYSEFEGIDFLKEYVASRQQYMDNHADMKDIAADYAWDAARSNNVISELLSVKVSLETGKQNDEIMDLLNAYTKSFEVRKRIYERYDKDWKPIGEKRFEDYEAYLLLAQCLELSYENTKCLKYFNCMLKVDDTLLSVQDKLNVGLAKVLYQIIEKELGIFYRLMEQNGVSLEE